MQVVRQGYLWIALCSVVVSREVCCADSPRFHLQIGSYTSVQEAKAAVGDATHRGIDGARVVPMPRDNPTTYKVVVGDSDSRQGLEHLKKGLTDKGFQSFVRTSLELDVEAVNRILEGPASDYFNNGGRAVSREDGSSSLASDVSDRWKEINALETTSPQSLHRV